MSGRTLSRPGSRSSCDFSFSASYIGCGNDGAIITVSVPTGVTPGAVGGSTLSPVVIAARTRFASATRGCICSRTTSTVSLIGVRGMNDALMRSPTRAR